MTDSGGFYGELVYHLGERYLWKRECNQCDFARALRAHLKTHSGEKGWCTCPWVRGICGKGKDTFSSPRPTGTGLCVRLTNRLNMGTDTNINIQLCYGTVHAFTNYIHVMNSSPLNIR